ncbi:putative tnpC protein [Mycobacterium kansasii 732]|nr:putative tnpC protein [Mycobacterium kansasii 732]
MQAESQHRAHAIIEQVFADLFAGPLAHLPSGKFNANAAWLALPPRPRAHPRPGCVGLTRTRPGRGATIRTQLINVAAPPARAGRDTITWHLPRDWPWEQHWLNAFHATHRGPPALAA